MEGRAHPTAELREHPPTAPMSTSVVSTSPPPPSRRVAATRPAHAAWLEYLPTLGLTPFEPHVRALREALEMPALKADPHPGRRWNAREIAFTPVVDAARIGLLNVRV